MESLALHHGNDRRIVDQHAVLLARMEVMIAQGEDVEPCLTRIARDGPVADQLGTRHGWCLRSTMTSSGHALLRHRGRRQRLPDLQSLLDQRL